ncbi:MAG: type I methionyl aminopeptidase [Bacteroidota bacterium]
MSKKLILKTADEIEAIRKSSLLVGKTLAEIAKLIRPGITSLELDRVANDFIRDHGAIPGFFGYHGFPNSICASVNQAVVHGIPTQIPLKEGDIISVDIGVIWEGYWGDSAYTFGVGELNSDVQQLLTVTKESLYQGIDQAIVGKRIGDIGFAVQSYTEGFGYGVVRELVGHGVGKNLHEAPEVPNYGRRGQGIALVEGMVLAIEPMINLGTKNVRQLKDGWTIETQDGKPSAHFEHTIAVGKNRAEVLSSFDEIEAVLAAKK